jgi:hypothetical protein
VDPQGCQLDIKRGKKYATVGLNGLKLAPKGVINGYRNFFQLLENWEPQIPAAGRKTMDPEGFQIPRTNANMNQYEANKCQNEPRWSQHCTKMMTNCAKFGPKDRQGSHQ